MAKKLTFDKLPAAVEKILELLSSEGSEHTALPEMLRRMTLLESKIDYLQKSLSPERPMMDMQSVCKALKLRPKAVSELAASGVLPTRTEGRRTFFYEDGVVKYFMTQPVWKEAVASKPAPAVPKVDAEGRQRVDIHAASALIGRSKAAIYILTSKGRIPFHKEGKKVYFFTDELREWLKEHPARTPR